jgi:hypothetical protein
MADDKQQRSLKYGDVIFLKIDGRQAFVSAHDKTVPQVGKLLNHVCIINPHFVVPAGRRAAFSCTRGLLPHDTVQARVLGALVCLLASSNTGSRPGPRAARTWLVFGVSPCVCSMS